jgi:hypothetical protein
MAAYGKGQMLGSGINPESFKQDYSGFSRAAEIQAQGLQNLGQSIGGAIQNYGEVKKEQKKVDAYNKASAKSIEAAITLGKSYGITAAEETLAPFLQSYNDPNLSPIEKAALLDEGKAMIPNVFGRFDQSQALAIDKAQLLSRGTSSTSPMSNAKLVEIAIPGGTQQMFLRDGVLEPIQINQQTGGVEFPAIGSDAIDQAINLNNIPSGVGTENLPPTGDGAPEYGPTATDILLGQGSVGFIPAEQVESRTLTKDEAIKLNLPSENSYFGKFVNGKLTGSPTVIQSTPNPIEAARNQAMDAPNIALIEKSQDSAQKLPSVQKAFDLLDSNAVKTGTFENYKVAAKRFFGQDVANEEQFMSLVGNLAMEAIDLTKGAISDREMTYFTQVLAPNIGKSVEGNKKILQFKIDAAKRDIEIGKKVTELFEKNATPSEVQAEVSKIMESNPLVKEKATTPTATPYTGLDDATKQALKDLNIDE